MTQRSHSVFVLNNHGKPDHIVALWFIVFSDHKKIGLIVQKVLKLVMDKYIMKAVINWDAF